MNIFTLYRTVSKDAGATFVPFAQAPVKVCTGESNAKATIKSEIKAMSANRSKWGTPESFISDDGLSGWALGGNRNAPLLRYAWNVTVRALDTDDAPVAKPAPSVKVSTVKTSQPAIAAPITEGVVLASSSESHDAFVARRLAIASETRKASPTRRMSKVLQTLSEIASE